MKTVQFLCKCKMGRRQSMELGLLNYDWGLFRFLPYFILFAFAASNTSSNSVSPGFA